MNNLLFAVMYSDKEIYDKSLLKLIAAYGAVKDECPEYDFDKFTPYYEEEMGKGLTKRFVVFEKAIEKKDLVSIKKETTDLEKKFSVDGKRQVNIDPGYIGQYELVLASFKRGRGYKQELGDGVYAHKVLEFDDGGVQTFWHTFPDYKENKESLIGLAKRD
ncbi:MAG TPA: DUF4416 family protein [Candidatus Nanoarchaeia archaeon]|nr:DUF4416 family protein [Candidatus Nanoarchaeia archaeon]